MADEIKVVNGTQLDAALELIGNAIRTKGETTERFPSAAAMAAAIEAIQAGGGIVLEGYEITAGTYTATRDHGASNDYQFLEFGRVYYDGKIIDNAFGMVIRKPKNPSDVSINRVNEFVLGVGSTNIPPYNDGDNLSASTRRIRAKATSNGKLDVGDLYAFFPRFNSKFSSADLSIYPKYDGLVHTGDQFLWILGVKLKV